MSASIVGKFIHVGSARFFVRGVSYGTFAPAADGTHFPDRATVARDFSAMARSGVNSVRTYTPPTPDVLDAAATAGLHAIIGLPWSQHIAFLDDRQLCRQIRAEIRRQVSQVANHSATLLLALGNEIPPGIVRWHGRRKIEQFLHDLYADAKDAAPDALFTYVNYPPTEYLELPFFDVCSFNVYLHHEKEYRDYIARLQNIAGHKPLLMAEAGADSIRLGEESQAALVAMQVRSAFAEGACGAVVFSWTDEWWRGGQSVDDWAFGLVDRDREPKLSLRAAGRVFASAPFREEQRRRWPSVSVVVCAYNAEATIGECLESLENLAYPDLEIIVVNDGSTDRTGEIARQYPWVTVLDVPNGGLAAARNIGLAAASCEIIAYTDADVRVDRDWLAYLVQPFLESDVVASGGPNVVPADDPWIAQCVARAPGSPTHVLLDDRIAEHVPGCNMAIRRDALLAIGGFNPIYLRAGDDVDVCWRLQAKGWKLGFAASALVWHRHRSTVRAYLRQQVGYGEGETWLREHHPEKFIRGHVLWSGHIYSPLPFVRSLSATRVNAGTFGTASFPSVYRTDAHPFAYMPHSGRWQAGSLAMIAAGAIAGFTPYQHESLFVIAMGLLALIVTVGKCAAHAALSDVDPMRPVPILGRRLSRILYRITITWLHFLQPFARLYGRIRGFLTPPVPIAAGETPKKARRIPPPRLLDFLRSARLIVGAAERESFWSESWLSVAQVLTSMTDSLRATRAVSSIEIDDGWWNDRDLSVGVNALLRFDVRAVVEEHGGGRCLVRTATRARPTLRGVLWTAVALWLVTLARHWLPIPSTPQLAVSALAAIAVGWWHVAGTAAVVRGAIRRAAIACGTHPLSGRREGKREAAVVRTPVDMPAAAEAVKFVTGGTQWISSIRRTPAVAALRQDGREHKWHAS